MKKKDELRQQRSGKGGGTVSKSMVDLTRRARHSGQGGGTIGRSVLSPANAVPQSNALKRKLI